MSLGPTGLRDPQQRKRRDTATKNSCLQPVAWGVEVTILAGPEVVALLIDCLKQENRDGLRPSHVYIPASAPRKLSRTAGNFRASGDFDIMACT